MGQTSIPTKLDFSFKEAEAIEGISLQDEPIRFDIASPIISTWRDLPRERMEDRHDKRDLNKFLQSVISVADIQTPYERKEIKELLKAGISYVSILFGRNGDTYPTVMLRCYVPSHNKVLNFERLTTVLSKTYCNEEGISWEMLNKDVETLGISVEMDALLTKFQEVLHNAKNRTDFEGELTSHVMRLV